MNKSLSQMIRDAVREYRNKYVKSEEVQDTIEMKIEKIISEKMEKIMEKFKLRDDGSEKSYMLANMIFPILDMIDYFEKFGNAMKVSGKIRQGMVKQGELPKNSL